MVPSWWRPSAGLRAGYACRPSHSLSWISPSRLQQTRGPGSGMPPEYCTVDRQGASPVGKPRGVKAPVTALMVQGCSSWAGKSLVATGLARSFVRRRVRVAPFKAINMANNARVVQGGEMATAQYLQALAARIEPDVRMNPVLVKPEGDTRSQVVVLGKVDRDLSRRAWRGRAFRLWPRIESAFRSLDAEVDLVIVEGAGSPAEFNLWDVDVANMRIAELARAAVLLVVDIDRGGAFAHLWGTWSLLPERHRSLIEGFVLNKFRGDQALLDPAPAELGRVTGVPVLGVIPYLN